MTRKLRRIAVGILAVLMILSAVVTAVIPAMAAESLGIGISYHANGEKIDGATFSVIKAASADKSSGSYVYTMVSPFDQSDINPNDIGSGVKAAAKTLKSLYKECADTVITGSDGKCSINVTDPGLYLVWQTDSAGTAKEYEMADPMIVFLPSPSEDGSAWNNTVTIEPKTSAKPAESTDDGDEDDDDDDDSGKGSIGAVSLYKVDENDRGIHLEGAVFSLYKSDGTKVGTYTTNSDGYIGVSYLSYGDYYFVEDKAPEGYVGSSNKISFTLSEKTSWSNDYPWNILVTNTKASPVPDQDNNNDDNSSAAATFTAWATGDAGRLTLWCIVLIACAAGIVIVIRQKRNER